MGTRFMISPPLVNILDTADGYCLYGIQLHTNAYNILNLGTFLCTASDAACVPFAVLSLFLFQTVMTVS